MLLKVAPQAPTRRARQFRIPERVAPLGEARGRVGLLLGCVQRVFFPDVHVATVRDPGRRGL